MNLSLKKLASGLSHQFKKSKSKSRFTTITWIQEKKLKHQKEGVIKSFALDANHSIKYKRPYEFLHTYKELFEEEIYQFTSDTTSPLIVDCGANIGMSVIYFKILFPDSQVIAFEPDDENFKMLELNCNSNGFLGIDCRKSAVWIHNEWLSFSAEGTQGSTIVSSDSTKNVVRVKSERLADIIKENKVEFLKIDIEGAELEVIRDCCPFFHNVKNLFVEYHGKANETEKLTEILSLLQPSFKTYIKMAADNLLHPYVQKSTGHTFDVQLNIFCYR
jgi:FkbM family methyltransferase